MGAWAADTAGVLDVGDGLLVRGRSLRHLPAEAPVPEFGVYLLGRPPPPTPWAARWVRWRDFWLPDDTDDLRDALREVLDRAAAERVEIACGGGRGRTGTALSCLCVLSGASAEQAIGHVRLNYHPAAVETPWQKRLVARIG